MKGVFWNLGRRDEATRLLGDLVAQQGLDLLVLTEAVDDPQDIVAALGQKGPGFLHAPTASRVQIFHRANSVHTVYDDAVMSIRRLQFGSEPEIILAAVHLPSQLHCTPDEQTALCPGYVAEIARAERVAQHQRTIVVGDFNMNPFDYGLVQATGFHATACREVAIAGSRIVHERAYRFFYNPMRRFFGDVAGRARGTWWRRESAVIAYFWHVLDQVLVRPDLLRFFDDAALDVLTRVNMIDLADNEGHPVMSDHFPLKFGLDFSGGFDERAENDA